MTLVGSKVRRIYVASSWRNERQPTVVRDLRAAGYDVYDFRHPAPNQPGFSWAQVEAEWRHWTPAQYRQALEHPAAARGFALDMSALRNSDATVLVLPCGRSAHLELGFAVATGQRTLVLCDQTLDEPELMYLMTSRICLTIAEVLAALKAD